MCFGRNIDETFGDWRAKETAPLHSQITAIDVDAPVKYTNDEKMEVFWIDAYEDKYNPSGTIYLFGKVFIADINSHVSCCVVVNNIDRILYVAPRYF